VEIGIAGWEPRRDRIRRTYIEAVQRAKAA